MLRYVLLAALVVAPCVKAQSADTTRRADSATVQHATTVAGLALSGFAEASYQYSSHPAGETITGHLYDRFQDQFSLDAVKVALDRAYSPTAFDAGVHAELLAGQNASVIQSRGLALGPEGDLTQAYVILNIPTPNGNGVQIQLGKMATLLGLEVIDDVDNPVWSGGNQFVFLEDFTSTGAQVSYRFSSRMDAQIRVTNGWDAVEARNGGKTVLGRLGLYPDTSSSIALFGYTGAEELNDPSALRSGAEALLWKKLAPAWNAWVQLDYGREMANAALPDSTRDAQWWAFGAWASHDFTSDVGLGARADYMADPNGARTSRVLGFPALAGQRVATATLTLNLRTWPHALVRPEVRYDWSTVAAYAGSRAQLTAGLGAAYIF
jgi:Putative beta-barrel porin-2, OmpL-like. bbp2